MIIHCEKCNCPVQILEYVYDPIRQATVIRIKCHSKEATVVVPDFEQPSIIIFKEK